jgi:hypothetical protein
MAQKIVEASHDNRLEQKGLPDLPGQNTLYTRRSGNDWVRVAGLVRNCRQTSNF